MPARMSLRTSVERLCDPPARLCAVVDIVMAYIVMAYRVMAYRVMAYIVMAYIVMAYIVMAYVVIAYIVMAYIVMAYIVIAYIIIAYIVMAYIVMGLYSNGRTRRHCDATPHERYIVMACPLEVMRRRLGDLTVACRRRTPVCWIEVSADFPTLTLCVDLCPAETFAVGHVRGHVCPER